MIQAIKWCARKRCTEAVAPADLPRTAAEVEEGEVYWVDLSAPTPEETERVFGEFFPVHTLTREDLTKPDRGEGAHFPKVEEFRDYLFVVVNPLPRAGEAVEVAPAGAPPRASRRFDQDARPQLSAVLTAQILITHHTTPLDCVTHTVKHLDRYGEAAHRGPDYLFHLVLDAMVDEYEPLVVSIGDELDRLERLVFQRPARRVVHRLLSLKRQVSFLRKTLMLEREVLARLVRGEFELVNHREMAYYRNVADHLERYAEMVDSSREMVADLMHSHLAAASHRLNEVMKVLTMISTVVLPMTLVAGVYGMNFDVMPELKWAWGYPMALAMMALVGAGSFWLFRRKGWV